MRGMAQRAGLLNTTSPSQGQGVGNRLSKQSLFAPPFREGVTNAVQAGDLAWGESPLQLRDSTGLQPVSPESLPIRGRGT
jgi:hypothetical protein